MLVENNVALQPLNTFGIAARAQSLVRVRRRLAPLRRLNGPTEAAAGPEPSSDVEAYYARWRIAATGLASRVRRIDPDQSKYTRNIV